MDSKKRKLGIENREKRENKEKTKRKQFALIPYKIWVNKGMIELINYCLQLTIYSYQKIGPNQLKNWTNRKKIPNSSNHVWIINSHTCLLRHLNTLTKLHVVLHICTPKLHIVLLDTSFLPLFCSIIVFLLLLLLLLHFGHFGDFSCVNGALFFIALTTLILGGLII